MNNQKINCQMLIIIKSNPSSDMQTVLFNSKTKSIKSTLKKNLNEIKKLLNISDIQEVSFTKHTILTNQSFSEHKNVVIIIAESAIDISENLINQMESRHILIITLDNSKFTNSHKRVSQVIFDNQTSLSLCDRVNLLIQDFVLEIQIENFFSIVDNEGEHFSEISLMDCKHKYVCNHQFYSYVKYNSSEPYLNFAWFFHNYTSDKFEFDKYLNFWKKFFTYYNNIYSASEFYDPLKKILNNHPNCKQLSRKKIKRLLKGLENGDYILVRIIKKPKKKIAKQLQALFPGISVKIGSICVVPYSKRFSYTKYNKHVSVYKFKIER